MRDGGMIAVIHDDVLCTDSNLLHSLAKQYSIFVRSLEINKCRKDNLDGEQTGRNVQNLGPR